MLVALVMLLSVGLMPALAAGYQPGTYEAKAQGAMGEITVSVTFTADAITEVKVGDHKETEGIATTPIERIPQAIVDGQTLAVDTVGGATLTSQAILDAVADCVKQAGGDPEALKAAPAQDADKADKTQETLETDVLVVGGGIAGLSAAMSAADQGAKVLLIDKMPALGGTTTLAGGFLVVVDSKLFDGTDTDDSLDAMLKWWDYVMDYNSTGSSTYPDRDKLINVLKDTGKTVDYLVENGVVFEPFTGFGPYACAAADGRGPGLVQAMQEVCEKKGVQVMLECKATALIVEDGVVVGVNAETRDSDLTITADSVVLATGGLSQNPEMVAQYSPGLTYAVSNAAVSNTGDGIRMALDAGAVMYEDSWGALNGTALAESYTKAVSGAADLSIPAHLSVNALGKRYADEDAEFRAALCYDMLMDGNAPFYSVFDASDDKLVPALEEGIALGEVLKGDSIEALAEAIGADAAVLTETVARYNALCDKGIDEDFGKNAELMTKLSESGPYYAVKFYPTLFGSASGVVTDNQGRVLNAQGAPIVGLYAAGEMSNRPFYDQNYVLAASLGLYSTMGMRAGAAAVTDKAQ